MKIDEIYFRTGKDKLVLKCFYADRMVEIVGYGAPLDKIAEPLSKLYLNNQSTLIAEATHLYNKLKEHGAKLTDGYFEKWLTDRPTYYGGCYLLDDLKKYPENKKIITNETSWENGITLYHTQVNNPASKFYGISPNSYPPLEAGIQLIKSHGGKVYYIPHALKFHNDGKMIFEDIIKNFDINGIIGNDDFTKNFTKEHGLEIKHTENP